MKTNPSCNDCIEREAKSSNLKTEQVLRGVLLYFFKMWGKRERKPGNTEMLHKVQNNFVALASGLLFSMNYDSREHLP